MDGPETDFDAAALIARLDRALEAHTSKDTSPPTKPVDSTPSAGNLPWNLKNIQVMPRLCASDNHIDTGLLIKARSYHDVRQCSRHGVWSSPCKCSLRMLYVAFETQ
jgi:hypothetical protein